MTEFTAELHDYFKEEFSKGYVFWGYVFNDKKGRFKDGTFIHTSKVLKVENNIAFTLNSTYKLVGGVKCKK